MTKLSTMDETFNSAYTAVVKLNNASISLLERNSCRAAALVICDALTVLKYALESLQGRNQSTSVLYPEMISRFVEHAMSQLLNKADDEPPPLMSCGHCDERCNFAFSPPLSPSLSDVTERNSILILNEHGENVSISRYAQSTSVVFYLSSGINDDDISPEMTSALILHNHGQIYHRLACNYHADNKKRADVLFEAAKRFFYLSKSLAQRVQMPRSVKEIFDTEAYGCLTIYDGDCI